MPGQCRVRHDDAGPRPETGPDRDRHRTETDHDRPCLAHPNRSGTVTAPARIAIVGAGMAGLACARALADAGKEAVIFDKGRGPGGRLATRRAGDGLRFDHGAQYVTAKGTGFASLLAGMEAAGAAAPWEIGHGRCLTGIPGMSAMARYLCEGLDIRQGALATSAREDGAGWLLEVDGRAERCERLVLAVPAPQAAALLGSGHPLVLQTAAVRMTPCLTLMAAFETAPGPFETRTFETRRDPEDPLAWIAREGAKPGRPDRGGWIAQAGPGWSAAHLEMPPEEVAPLMLGLLCDRLGVAVSQTRHAVAHRWRHAAVAEPLGRPFLRSAGGGLYLGGDWCLGARVEAAWESGTAIARDMLETA